MYFICQATGARLLQILDINLNHADIAMSLPKTSKSKSDFSNRFEILLQEASTYPCLRTTIICQPSPPYCKYKKTNKKKIKIQKVIHGPDVGGWTFVIKEWPVATSNHLNDD